MATYRAIAATEVDPDSPVTATLMEAAANNPTAIAEGASGAPYSGSAIRPHDGVTVGDGNDGLLYDFAVDGAVASVQTPNFVSGYRYTLRVVNSSHAAGANQDLEVDWFETGPTLLGTSTLVSAAVDSAIAGRATASVNSDDFSVSFPSTTITQAVRPVLYGVVQYSAGANFDAGKIYLFRERDYSGRL